MEIKNVREPSEEEKESLLPKLVLFGITTAILTTVIYLVGFQYGTVGESLFIAEKVASKEAAYHDLLMKLFEFVYGRDYMLSKLEGLPISAMAAVASETVIGVIYKGYQTVEEVKGQFYKAIEEQTGNEYRKR